MVTLSESCGTLVHLRTAMTRLSPKIARLFGAGRETCSTVGARGADEVDATMDVGEARVRDLARAKTQVSRAHLQLLIAAIPYAACCTVIAAVLARLGALVLDPLVPVSRTAVVTTLVVVQLLVAAWFAEPAARALIRAWHQRQGLD